MLTLLPIGQQASHIFAICRRALLCISLLTLSGSLLSCGQTGPLVLPEKPANTVESTQKRH